VLLQQAVLLVSSVEESWYVGAVAVPLHGSVAASRQPRELSVCESLHAMCVLVMRGVGWNRSNACCMPVAVCVAPAADRAACTRSS
jgi:hypothetical protein